MGRWRSRTNGWPAAALWPLMGAMLGLTAAVILIATSRPLRETVTDIIERARETAAQVIEALPPFPPMIPSPRAEPEATPPVELAGIGLIPLPAVPIIIVTPSPSPLATLQPDVGLEPEPSGPTELEVPSEPIPTSRPAAIPTPTRRIVPSATTTSPPPEEPGPSPTRVRRTRPPLVVQLPPEEPLLVISTAVGVTPTAAPVPVPTATPTPEPTRRPPTQTPEPTHTPRPTNMHQPTPRPTHALRPCVPSPHCTVPWTPPGINVAATQHAKLRPAQTPRPTPRLG